MRCKTLLLIPLTGRTSSPPADNSSDSIDSSTAFFKDSPLFSVEVLPGEVLSASRCYPKEGN